MICPKCNTNNPYGSTFCQGCGAPLTDSQKAQANIVEASNNYGNTSINANKNYYDNSPYSSYNSNQTPAYPGNSAPVNQPYQQNMVNYPPYNDPNAEHVSTLSWIGIFCINLIPFIGYLVYLVMLFVWAFGSTPKRSLKTFAQAQLIVSAVVIGLVILFMIITGLSISEFVDELS